MVFSFISEHYPVIGGALILVLVAYNATMYHVSIQNTRKRVDNLPCEFHSQSLAGHAAKIDIMRDILVKMYNRTNKNTKFDQKIA